jgi:hypothetical protein
MSSVKLTVSVYDGSRLVETLSDRPVRLTPDGKAGVVYAGEVYPVYSDNSISLGVRPTKKSLCYSFLSPGAKIPYAGRRAGATVAAAGIGRWYLESNRFGHYIVFDSTRDAASSLVDRLRNERISVVRWDASVRPADNGELYDWFVRLDYDGTAEQCRQAIAPIVTGVPLAGTISSSTIESTVRAASLAAEVSLLKIQRDQAVSRVDELEGVASRAGELEKRASEEAAKASKLERQVARLQRQHAAQLAAASTDAAQLREQLAAARSERDKAETVGSASDRTEQIIAAKASAEHEWLLAQEEAETLRAERDALALNELTLQDELAESRETIEQLKGEVVELEDAERERRARRHAGSPQGGSYEDFMCRVLPRLWLDPDDLELLLSWPTPREAMQTLLEISAGGRPRHGKPVEARRGWTEVAGINTGRKGSENLGRIYYHPMKSSNQVRVCLHDKQDKKEQTRFMERLPDVD